MFRCIWHNERHYAMQPPRRRKERGRTSKRRDVALLSMKRLKRSVSARGSDPVCKKFFGSRLHEGSRLEDAQGLSTLATGSRSDRNSIAIQPQRCPHLQLDRNRIAPIAIRPIHISRWFRSRSDRDRLNPIRNSGRYLHARYACSWNI